MRRGQGGDGPGPRRVLVTEAPHAGLQSLPDGCIMCLSVPAKVSSVPGAITAEVRAARARETSPHGKLALSRVSRKEVA